MGWAQERWAASPHCRQSLTVGHQWSCAVSCLGEPCPEPTWQGCLLSTAISPPWFLELWGAEPLRGPGEELGTPSPLGVLGGVSVVQPSGLTHRLSQPAFHRSPSLESSWNHHWPAERTQGPVTIGAPRLPSAIPWGFFSLPFHMCVLFLHRCLLSQNIYLYFLKICSDG